MVNTRYLIIIAVLALMLWSQVKSRCASTSESEPAASPAKSIAVEEGAGGEPAASILPAASQPPAQSASAASAAAASALNGPTKEDTFTGKDEFTFKFRARPLADWMREAKSLDRRHDLGTNF